MTTSKDKTQQFMESPLVAWVSGSLERERIGREESKRREFGWDMNFRK